MVYSRDLIPQDSSSAPINENVPIIQLNENQKVVLEAAQLLPREHLKM